MTMKRFTALVLAIAMIFGCMPVNALAETTSDTAGGLEVRSSGPSYRMLAPNTTYELVKGAPAQEYYIYTEKESVSPAYYDWHYEGQTPLEIGMETVPGEVHASAGAVLESAFAEIRVP